MMPRFGLLGKKLSHSYSKEIHAYFGDYVYELCETDEAGIERLLSDASFSGFNVTIPYKKTVVPFLSRLSDTAARTGSVNTVLRLPDGSLYGDNTDVYGFASEVKRAGEDLRGKKAVVFGTGGASAAVRCALEELGAEVVTVGRHGADNYENLSRHADALTVVNATPVGMYPENGVSPADLSVFPNCRRVFDLIYNPARTALMMQAESLGIPSENGLYMLVFQAKRSAELFTGGKISDALAESVVEALAKKTENVVLIGMPGCGKTSAAREISRLTGRKLVDTDEEIERLAGKAPSRIIEEDGEEAFRAIEAKVVKDVGRERGRVIATGGGVVTRSENYAPLHQNGKIVYIKRDLSLLALDGRPVTKREGAKSLFEKRKPLYERFADAEVDSAESAHETARLIIGALGLETEG